jgi:hypothetical protein
LCDHSVTTSGTRVFLFFSVQRALQSFGFHPGPGPFHPTTPPSTTLAPPPTFGPALPPGFTRAARGPSSTLGPSARESLNDKLRGTFKCSKFLVDARHWKQWNKDFVRFLAIQLLDHVVDASFKQGTLTIALHEDNKSVCCILDDAMSGSPVATKHVRRAPERVGAIVMRFITISVTAVF